MRLYRLFRAARACPQKCDLTGSMLHARIFHPGLLALFFPCSKAPTGKPVYTELHSDPEHLNFLNYVCPLLVKWLHSSFLHLTKLYLVCRLKLVILCCLGFFRLFGRLLFYEKNLLPSTDCIDLEHPGRAVFPEYLLVTMIHKFKLI